MINFADANFLIHMIALSTAYLCVATLAGCLAAWMAEKLGDPTAAHYGYATLDPFMHVEPVGMACLLLLGIGWTANVPLHDRVITGPGAFLRKLLTHFCHSFAFFVVGTCAYVLLSCMLAPRDTIMGIASGDISGLYETGCSPFVATIAGILIKFVYIALMLASIKTILAVWRFVKAHAVKGTSHERSALEGSADLMISLMLMNIFGVKIRIMMIQAMLIVGHIVTFPLGFK